MRMYYDYLAATELGLVEGLLSNKGLLSVHLVAPSESRSVRIIFLQAVANKRVDCIEGVAVQF